MPRSAFRRAWWILMLAACVDEPVAPYVRAPGPVTVVVAVEPDSVPPGHATTISLDAIIPDDQRLTSVAIQFGGLFPSQRFDLPILGDGTHQYRISLKIFREPVLGQVRMDAFALVDTVGDSASAVLTVFDDGPPTVTLTLPRAVEPPDSIELRYDGSDVSDLDSMFVHVYGGSGTLLDSVIVRQQARYVGGVRALPLPAGTRLGDSIVARAQAFDLFGRTTIIRRAAVVADTTPPTIAGAVAPVPHAELDSSYPALTFFPGDTIRVRVSAADGHSLRHLGYRWLHLGDSVTPGGSADSARFDIVVPPGTNTAEAHVALWAADSSGNVGALNIFTPVRDGLARPIATLSPAAAPAGVFHPPGGSALDVARERLYVASFDAGVHVFALDPPRQLPSIPFGSEVRSVDLSPGGDSLVALVQGQPPRLVSWRLGAGPTPMDTVLLTGASCGAWDMRVAANGRALVAGCEILEVLLATRQQRGRGATQGAMALVRSPDGRFIVQWDELRAAVYQSDSDSLAPLVQLFPTPPASMPLGNPGPYVNPQGSILVRNRRYDPRLTVYQQVLPDPGQFPNAQALSHDGRFAYIGNWPGYWKVDTQTGVVLERVLLPHGAGRLIPHPDGERLIVLTGGWLGVVDLR